MANFGKPYTGVHRHNLDDKDRLTIPAEWRAAHAEGDVFMATPHPEGHIAVLPPAAVAQMMAKFAEVPYLDPGQAGISRFLARCHSFTFDKQGRLTLPEKLRAHAGIKREAILAPGANKFLIYSPETWARIEGEGDLGDILRNLPVSF